MGREFRRSSRSRLSDPSFRRAGPEGVGSPLRPQAPGKSQERRRAPRVRSARRANRWTQWMRDRPSPSGHAGWLRVECLRAGDGCPVDGGQPRRNRTSEFGCRAEACNGQRGPESRASQQPPLRHGCSPSDEVHDRSGEVTCRDRAEHRKLDRPEADVTGADAAIDDVDLRRRATVVNGRRRSARTPIDIVSEIGAGNGASPMLRRSMVERI